MWSGWTLGSKKLLVGRGLPRSGPPHQELRLTSYPSGMSVSNRALQLLAGALRCRRGELRTRWRRLDAGRQALLVLAHLRKGETYADLACGFAVGVTTAYRYVKE